jgi:hypothetical protein
VVVDGEWAKRNLESTRRNPPGDAAESDCRRQSESFDGDSFVSRADLPATRLAKAKALFEVDRESADAGAASAALSSAGRSSLGFDVSFRQREVFAN